MGTGLRIEKEAAGFALLDHRPHTREMARLLGLQQHPESPSDDQTALPGVPPRCRIIEPHQGTGRRQRQHHDRLRAVPEASAHEQVTRHYYGLHPDSREPRDIRHIDPLSLAPPEILHTRQRTTPGTCWRLPPCSQ